MFAFVVYSSSLQRSLDGNKDCWTILDDATILEHDILEGVVVDSYTPKKSSSGWTSAAGTGSGLPKMVIPMMRRTFPELITNDIVSVQPMSGPVGLAFALKYKYEDTNGDPKKSRYSKPIYTWFLYETMDDLIAAHFTDLL